MYFHVETHENWLRSLQIKIKENKNIKNENYLKRCITFKQEMYEILSKKYNEFPWEKYNAIYLCMDSMVSFCLNCFNHFSSV